MGHSLRPPGAFGICQKRGTFQGGLGVGEPPLSPFARGRRWWPSRVAPTSGFRTRDPSRSVLIFRMPSPAVWGTNHIACKDTALGKGWACPSSSAEEVAPRWACVISTAGSVITEEAYRLSASSRSHWRKERDKEGFKKKITKRKTVISNPKLALLWLC